MPNQPRASLGQFDAVEWLGQFADDSVDLVITDPPYESLEKHRAIGTTTRLKHSKASSNDWFEIFPNSRFPELFSEVYRVLKPNRHFYLFCDQETMFVAKPLAEAAGFHFWKPLIWDKMKIGMGYHYRARHEYILFFEKGKRRLNDLGVADVIQVPRIHRGYPTEKPSAVSEVLVSQSTCDGELVIDPFLGAGGVGVASASLGRDFRGNDIRANALDISRERLEQAGAQLEAEPAPASRPAPISQLHLALPAPPDPGTPEGSDGGKVASKSRTSRARGATGAAPKARSTKTGSYKGSSRALSLHLTAPEAEALA